MRTELYGHEIEYETQDELSEKLKVIRASKIPKHLRKKFASKLDDSLLPESVIDLNKTEDDSDDEELALTEEFDRQGEVIIFPIDHSLYITPKLEGDEVKEDTVPDFTLDGQGNPVLTNPVEEVVETATPTVKTEDIKETSTKQTKRK